MSPWLRHVHAPLHKVVPAEDLLCPELEAVQQFQITAVRQRQLPLAELDKAIDGLVVVVHAWVCDEVVYPVHFH